MGAQEEKFKENPIFVYFVLAVLYVDDNFVRGDKYCVNVESVYKNEGN